MVIHIEYKNKMYKGECSPFYCVESAIHEMMGYILEVYINGFFYSIKGPDIESCISTLYNKLYD